MITRESVKAEIDKVQDKYLEVLYKIIKALINSPERVAMALPTSVELSGEVEPLDWHKFIEETYGCLADDPLERGKQGRYEIREAIK
jgi:hypothetical protein